MAFEAGRSQLDYFQRKIKEEGVNDSVWSTGGFLEGRDGFRRGSLQTLFGRSLDRAATLFGSVQTRADAASTKEDYVYITAPEFITVDISLTYEDISEEDEKLAAYDRAMSIL